MSVPATTTSNNNQISKSPVSRLKEVMAAPSVAEQFRNALADNSALFVASVIDLYASDTYLQKCDPALVVAECLKAAVLKLPISKSLGFAYVVPYQKSKKVGAEWVKESIPQFQIGYRGLLQLAMRSGIYRCINADMVYAGELRSASKLTGEIDLSGERNGDEIIGYFAHIETTNGFKKTMYQSQASILAHAKRYSKAFDQKEGPWQKNFDQMAIKTVFRMLLSKYGLLSVEMVQAIGDEEEEPTPTAMMTDEIAANANGQVIDMPTGEVLNHQPVENDDPVVIGPDY